MGFIVLILLIAAVDLCIKEEVEARDAGEFPRELEGTGGKILLHRNHNAGFPFQVLKNRPELVKAVPVIVISSMAGILGFLIPKKGFWTEKITLTLTLGGALSNLYDRIKRGYVVDYFSINKGKLKDVTFNLGDICILASAALSVLASVISSSIGIARKIMSKR